MPGVLHQGILDLLCDDPWLPFDILGRDRPGSGPVRDRRAEVEGLPDAPKRVQIGLPDLVLTSEANADTPGVVLCVEAQGRRDDSKRYAIPFYHGALAHRHQRPTWVIVVSFSRAMSRALDRWSCGPPPRVDAVLLDAATVPVPYAPVACARPSAAVLAASLHGCRGDIEAARAGIHACQSLPPKLRLRYIRTILAAVSEPLRKRLEMEIPVENNPLWEIERRSSPYVYGRREGLEQGLEQGRREGRREVLLSVLEARGLDIDPHTRARIESCDDLDTLRTWARRAALARSVDDLWSDGS